jgi:GTPase SAR1 family protein
MREKVKAMSNTNTIPGIIEAIRQRTIQVLEDLATKSRAFDLPEPPSSLQEQCLKLQANTYKVLVIGEAKRGKSTFVNALIGRSILPTDVDVATSQIFRIRSTPLEAYRLRFEDGSEREIVESNLADYGSQMVADAKGIPRLDQIIRWIEVDVPAKWLPAGVSLLDTPGLGSLYSAHAQITQRFLPFADAVIFVLDSNQPILQTELVSIETILGVTRNIFFIQTKIDQHRREKWQALQQRHQEILQERFGDRLIDTRVWPISSTSLLKSMQADDQTDSDDYLSVSKYPQLSAILQVFLFRVAGWERAAAALETSEDYWTLMRKTLAGRWTTTLEESEQKRADLQRRIAQRKQQFDTEWGEHGQRREELLTDISTVVLKSKQSFLQELSGDSEIVTTLRNKIDGLKSFEEAKQYSRVLDEQLVKAFLDRWQYVCQQAQQQCSVLFIPFFNAANAVSFPEEINSPPLKVKTMAELRVKENWKGLVDTAYGEVRFVLEIIGVFLPVPNVITTVAALCWAAIRAWSFHEDSRLEDAKQQLNERLSTSLQVIVQNFLGMDKMMGYQNRVESYFDALVHVVTEQVQKIIAQKSAEAQGELDRLSEEATLDEQQRKVRAEQMRRQLTEWDAIHQSIKEIVADLQMIDRALLLFSAYTAY